MPRQGKARRAAVRQTQLGQKKKRVGRSPADAPPVIIPTPQRGGDTSVSTDETPTPPVATQPVKAQRAAPFRTEQRAAVYRYVGPEIKRIAVVTAGILAVLIVLTFVLR